MLPLSQAKLLGDRHGCWLHGTSEDILLQRLHRSTVVTLGPEHSGKQLREQQRDIRQLSVVTSGFFILR